MVASLVVSDARSGASLAFKPEHSFCEKSRSLAVDNAHFRQSRRIASQL
jgi:hypothetical protein